MVHRAALTSLFLVLTLIVPMSQAHAQQVAQDTGSMHNRITITIGEKVFAATLADNPTADAFRKLLPLSLTMSELNGHEKLFRLPANLPTQESVPPSIQAGDLMLYGARTVVLFYKSFPTVYSYIIRSPLLRSCGLGAVQGHKPTNAVRCRTVPPAVSSKDRCASARSRSDGGPRHPHAACTR